MTNFSKILFLTIIITFTFPAIGENVNAIASDKARKAELMKLVDKEIKMLEGLKSYGPTIQFRLVELYAEKIKLMREKENELLLNEQTKKAFVDKDKYFSQSKRLYLHMRDLAINLSKTSPNYQNLPHMFYIMGINSRDFDQAKETERYLIQALKSKRIAPQIEQKSHVALAEYYYNEKKYRPAIKHYIESIKELNDQWLTKHWYNLAWCYFKIKDFPLAISSLEKSFFLGQDKRYIPVEEQALDTISIFHTNGGQVSRAIDFYQKNVKNPSSYLMLLAERASKKGDKLGAQQSINASISSYNENKADDIVDLHFRALKIYRQFSDAENYFKHSNEIDRINSKNKASKELVKDISEEIRSYTGYIQEKFIKQYQSLSAEASAQTLSRIMNYFEIIIRLNNDTAPEMIFYQGETYFAIADYTTSANYYIKSIQKHKANKATDIVILRKSLDALLASLEHSNLPNNKLKPYLIYTYENYLQFFPKDQTTRSIYPKLSNLYLAQKKPELTEKTLDRYMSSFPEDLDKTQSIAVSIIDYHIKNKNNYEMAKWVERIRGGFLSFNSEYIEKAQTLLGNMLFQTIKKSENTLRLDEIIVKYNEIYNDKNYPNRIKEEASFNIAAMYLKMYETEKSYLWITRSNRLREKDKGIKLLPQLNSMMVQYYLRQDLQSAEGLSEYITKLICKTEMTGKSAYYIQYISLLAAQDKMEKLTEARNLFKDCGAQINKDIQQYMQHIISEQYAITKSIPRALSNAFDLNYNEEELRLIENAFWEKYPSITDTSKRQITDFFERSKNQDLVSRAKELLDWSIWDNKPHSLSKGDWEVLYTIAKSTPFNQEAFNSQLEIKLSTLANFEKEVTPFLSSKNSNIALSSTYKLSKEFTVFSEYITGLNINSGDKDFDKAFKQAMKSIALKIEKKGQQLITQTKNEMTRSQILSSCAYQIDSSLGQQNCQKLQIFPNLLYDGIVVGGKK